MIVRTLLSSCAIWALAVPCAVLAQDVEGDPPPPDQLEEQQLDDDIIVRGERLRAQVDTTQAPILELDAQDIAAYGAGSIADLVAAIEPQTSSSRGRGGGRPVFLVNGIRVGSFREFRSYPPESIRKVEVLPEETAQLFGFPPDRRVINFILKDDYSAITLEAEYEQPDRGGYSVTEQEATLLKITAGGRLNLNVEFRDVTLLTEDERGIIQTPGSIPDVASDPDPAVFRSLVADSAQIEATANWAKAFVDSGSSLSLNATFERDDSRSLAGLDTVLLVDPGGNAALRTFNPGDPLERRSRTHTASTAASYTRPLGDFRLTATADASLADLRTEIDRRADVAGLTADAVAGVVAIDAAIPALPDAGFDIVDRDTYAASSKVTIRGAPLLLPAGELNTTLDVGYDWNRIESADSRAVGAARLTRGDLSGGLNVAIPLTSTRDNVLAAIGSITLNGQVGFDRYSDFGTLYRWSGGVNWGLTDSLDLQATYVQREVPPSLAQLGNPAVTNLNVPTFDFTNGETALVSVISGGNPALSAETQSDWNFSANWQLPFIDGARFRIDYVRNRSNDVSSSFPFLTPEIETAFPGRVTRDAAGMLTALDRRPVDFFETRTQRVSFGLTLRGRFGQAAGEGPRRATTRDGGATGNAGQSAEPPARARGAAGQGRFGPRSSAQRERFMAFRQRVCADDGEAFLLRLAEAARKGEPVEGLADFGAERAERMLSRLRAEDGSIDQERISRFRTRICERSGRPGRSERPGRPERQLRGDGSPQTAEQGARPAAASGRRGRGGPPSFGRRAGVGRYFVNLTHSIELDRQILIAPGGPQLDLLDGDSLSSTGTPRHTARLEAGVFKDGLGMRLSGRYTGSTRIDGSGAPGSTDLFVDDLATLDIRLFADLGAVLKKEQGLFKGMRASLRFNNVFDGRRIVTDSNGDIPLSFQPLLVDPTGRYIGFELRKLF